MHGPTCKYHFISVSHFIFLILALIPFSCTQKVVEKEVHQAMDSTPCPPAVNIDSLKRAIAAEMRDQVRRNVFMQSAPESNQYSIGGQYKTEYTFSEKTPVYAEPDTTSKIIAVLPFSSKVHFVEGLRKQQIQGNFWIKISNPESIKDAAYVREQDLADYVDIAYGNSSGFLVGEAETVIEGVNHRTVEIRRYQKDKHVILERYKTTYKANGYRFNKVLNSTLLGVRREDEAGRGSLFVYETFRQSCPGGGVTEFIIDDGRKLRTVTSVSSEGEGGYYDLETAYIPLKSGKGKILLIANADTDNIFNRESAELNVFPYSPEYKVPVEDVVVVKRENNGYENADYGVDPATVKVNTTVTIYKWDGKNLVKVKELE